MTALHLSLFFSSIALLWWATARAVAWVRVTRRDLPDPALVILPPRVVFAGYDARLMARGRADMLTRQAKALSEQAAAVEAGMPEAPKVRAIGRRAR